MPPLLELAGVSVSYGAYSAVESLSLAVPEGSVVALLGPNGAGKTTTLKAISGLVAPRSGAIRLAGRRIDGLPAHRIARAGVCHIPEGRGIFPSLTVIENLRMAAGDGEEGWTDRVLGVFPVLGKRFHQMAGTLSGGEQQMLALARALTRRPAILMADELSLGLAPKLVGELFDAVAAMHRAGGTIVLVEQYVSHALRIADLVYVLAQGRLVFCGEPGEVRHAGGLVSSYLGS
jgi:branched-chain amino acid transport system ATP-binding protein